jgi:hypothetical protein
LGCGIDRVYTCNGSDSALVKFGSADCKFVAAVVPKPAAAPAPDDSGGDEPAAETSADDNG